MHFIENTRNKYDSLSFDRCIKQYNKTLPDKYNGRRYKNIQKLLLRKFSKFWKNSNPHTQKKTKLGISPQKLTNNRCHLGGAYCSWRLWWWVYYHIRYVRRLSVVCHDVWRHAGLLNAKNSTRYGEISDTPSAMYNKWQENKRRVGNFSFCFFLFFGDFWRCSLILCCSLVLRRKIAYCTNSNRSIYERSIKEW